MAKENGSRFKAYIMDGTPTATEKLISEQTSLSINREVKTIDVTSKDNTGYEEFIGGLQSGQADVEFICDLGTPTGNAGYMLLSGVAAARSIRQYVFKYPTAAGPILSISLSALITNYDVSAPMEDKITVKCTLKRSGAPTETLAP